MGFKEDDLIDLDPPSPKPSEPKPKKTLVLRLINVPSRAEEKSCCPPCSKPRILLLHLDNCWPFEIYQSLFDILKKTYQLDERGSGKDAAAYLKACGVDAPRAVLALDEGVPEDGSKAMFKALRKYIKQGGTLIMGFHMTVWGLARKDEMTIRVKKMEKVFQQLGVTWELACPGDYELWEYTNGIINHQCTNLPHTSAYLSEFPKQNRFKCLPVKVREEGEILYHREACKEYSAYNESRHMEAVVACKRIHDGAVWWIGQSIEGEVLNTMVLRLIGLNISWDD
ncbi:MAG: hypothetical protein M1834_006349 [Cirrosporium novae-zelandiae]|nr:MAG: hypothetical protein M1834_006349 [Cirrosporium novae-zelandiae]